MSVVNFGQACPVVFGSGALEALPEKARNLGMSKVLLVTEAELISLGISSRAKDVLESNGIKVVLFDKVTADPKDALINEGADFLASVSDIDGIIGCGGGSSMDSAKCIAMVNANGGVISDYYYTNFKKVERGLPVILIPTTSGTGSETSAWTVVTDSETGLKNNTSLFPADLALVDPALTYTLPAGQTSSTGLDTLAHGFSAITADPSDNPYIRLMGCEVIKLVFENLPAAVNEPSNRKAREKMSLAACYGGMILSDGLALQFDHSFGEVFGAKYHRPHGLCCAWGLPGAVAMTAKYDPEKTRLIAPYMGVCLSGNESEEETIKLMTDRIVQLMRDCRCQTLKEAGYTLDDCLSLAGNIMSSGQYGAFPKKNMSREEVEYYLKLTYEAYQ